MGASVGAQVLILRLLSTGSRGNVCSGKLLIIWGWLGDWTLRVSLRVPRILRSLRFTTRSGPLWGTKLRVLIQHELCLSGVSTPPIPPSTFLRCKLCLVGSDSRNFLESSLTTLDLRTFWFLSLFPHQRHLREGF